MPKQTNLQFTGRLGNLILYKVDDLFLIRSAPGHVKQTTRTKKRATEFGKASTVGRILRRQLMPVIPFTSDIKMQTRLVSALFAWLRTYDPASPSADVTFISRYQFAQGATIQERWRADLEVTHPEPGRLELKIPAFVPKQKISAPSGTVTVKCVIAVAGCHVERGAATGGTSMIIDYDYNSIEVPEQIVSLAVPTSAGSLVVTAVSLEFLFNKSGQIQKTRNKAFMPSGVISAMYF